MLWKIVCASMLMVLFTIQMMAETPNLNQTNQKIQEVVGRIHPYGEYYILKESGYKKQYYILLSSPVIQKAMPHLDLLQEYWMEGYLYQMNSQKYLLPTQICSIQTAIVAGKAKTGKSKIGKKNVTKKTSRKSLKKKQPVFHLGLLAPQSKRSALTALQSPISQYRKISNHVGKNKKIKKNSQRIQSKKRISKQNLAPMKKKKSTLQKRYGQKRKVEAKRKTMQAQKTNGQKLGKMKRKNNSTGYKNQRKSKVKTNQRKAKATLKPKKTMASQAQTWDFRIPQPFSLESPSTFQPNGYYTLKPIEPQKIAPEKPQRYTRSTP